MENNNVQNADKKDTQGIHTNSWINQHTKKVIIGLIVTAIFSVVANGYGLLAAAKLYPFAENDRIIFTRIEAIEKNTKDIETDRVRVAILEEQNKVTNEMLKDIRAGVQAITNVLIK